MLQLCWKKPISPFLFQAAFNFRWGRLLATNKVTMASAYCRADRSNQVMGSGVRIPLSKNPRWPPCLVSTNMLLGCVFAYWIPISTSDGGTNGSSVAFNKNMGRVILSMQKQQLCFLWYSSTLSNPALLRPYASSSSYNVVEASTSSGSMLYFSCTSFPSNMS